jgi:hypothetical protein
MSFFFPFVAFWLFVHLFHRAALRWHRQNYSIISPVTRAKSYERLAYFAGVTVTVKPLHVEVSSTNLNDMHDALSSRLNQVNRRESELRKGMMLFYNLGSAFGALGLLLVLGVLAWTGGQLLTTLISSANGASLAVDKDYYLASSTAIHRMTKRSYEQGPDAAPILHHPALRRDYLLQPIVSILCPTRFTDG